MPAEKPREIHPAGTFAAICVDLIDLGMRVSEFSGHEKATQSLAFVFRTGKVSSTGFDLDLSREFAVSLHKKSNMRAFLEAWRGAPLKSEELGEAFSFKDMASRPALISVVHKPSSDGTKIYANIGAIMPVPDGMPIPKNTPYERAPFWASRKEDYAKEFRRFERQAGGDEPELGSEEIPF